MAAVAACGRAPSISQRQPTTTAIRSATSTTTTTTVSTGSPVNLTVTDQVRAELIAAGALLLGIPASEYGLQPGRTYYAFDPATGTYWAGAELVGTTYRAAVSTQSENSYMLFHHTANEPWRARAVGMNGPSALAGPCPVSPPPAVVALWGWQTFGCHPDR
jgi:hypothetical protein